MNVTAIENAYRLVAGGDVGRAVAELRRSGGAGEPASLLELAVWHLEGRYVPRDLPLSRGYFQQAGELGEARAENVYISFLANGIGGKANWQEAKNRLHALARYDAIAARQIGLLEGMAILADGCPVAVAVGKELSSAPAVWAFDDFFSPAECSYLIEKAQDFLEPSVVVDPATGELRPHPVRTSDGAAFPWVSEDLVISALNRRIAAASGTDVRCGEPLQVLRYRPGQEYRPHLDALPARDNQRVLTMLVYLNEEYDGGETLFTRAGLKFAGGRGDGLLFRNGSPGGLPDLRAEHAGLPVRHGEKYVASRWIRERPMAGS
jgi:prolyl 4-hydroxylase